MRFFFHIGYNGKNYRGWQRQKNALSIQQVFEQNLSMVFKTKITCIGCGRTDAQVHASQFFFHADIQKSWKFDLHERLNIMLPREIAIFDIIPVENDKHAQFDAISRTYDYFLHIYKDPFLNELSALYQEKELNLVNMQTAANLLKKYKNFKAFCLTPDKNSTTLCEITEANLFCNQSGDQIRFQISSNRFLKGMVRIIMRMMIDIGNHKLSLDQFENYLISKEIKTSHHLAFPQGLYLSKVDYSFLNIPARTHFLTSHNHQWTKIIP